MRKFFHRAAISAVVMAILAASMLPIGSSAQEPASQTPAPATTSRSETYNGLGTAVWLYAMLGLGALAFGVGGVAAARKSR